MRIIAGRYRGRRLTGPPSDQTRPTSDRLRETLFNILAPRIEGARVLDLCAGTGAVGLEALSRGAAHVTFVDRSRKMCELIQTNIEPLQIDGAKFAIEKAEAVEFLRRQVKRQAEPCDVIFFDPPYATDYEIALDFLGEHYLSILDAEGILIVEHYKKKPLSDEFGALKRYRELKQGDSVLSFYKVAT